MKKQSGLFIGMVMVCLLAVSNGYAGGLMDVGQAVLEGAAEEVGKGAGQIIDAGTDWAEKKITGNETVFKGNVDFKAKNETGSIYAAENARVNIGSSEIVSSRFEKDLNIKTVNTTGAITADPEADIAIGGTRIEHGKFFKNTSIKTENKTGTVRAGQKATIKVGVFDAH